jgi:thioesterase domain-containing protein
MAAEYADVITRARGSGPIALGGYCHGALVAFEVARLLSRDREITNVLMVHPSPIESRLLAIDRMVGAIGRLRRSDNSAHTRAMVRIVTALQFLRQAQASDVRAWAWRKVQRMLRARTDTEGPSIRLRTTGTLRHDPLVWETVVHAVIAYVPRAYNGEISLFVPPGHAESDRGWGRFASQAAIVPVPGDHRTCVTTYAETLGGALEAQLASSRAHAIQRLP